MKDKMYTEKEVKRTKNVVRVMMFFILLLSAIFLQKGSQVQAAEKKIIGYGVLNTDWVNLGLNWQMTGGTSGRVVSGETFIVYEKKIVNNNSRYYVYAENAGIYGYISDRFIIYMPSEEEITGYGTLNTDWVNLGLNWKMTGGTSGRVVSGETFIVYEKHSINNINRYYVYAENAGIYGYISERFIKITPIEEDTDTETENEQKTQLDVALHVQETNKTCGVANVKMILDYLDIRNASGRYISESTLWDWANSNGEGTYVYRIAQTLTNFGVSYKYVNMNKSDAEDYWEVLEDSLEKNRPVIVPVRPTKNDYWSYSTGHYILVTGINIDDNGEKQVIINDCHYRYSAEDKVVPLKELIRVNKKHSSYMIIGK